MSVSDLGKRITAARGYRAMDLASLADSINVTAPALQRFEAGVEPLSEGDQWALIGAIAEATQLPVSFFTTDFQSLPNEGPPEARLDRLEHKIDHALERMDKVIEEAENQMARGKEQLDRFIAAQEPERDLLRRVAAHLDVHTD
jgi:transcriptional regulator with XRE-family HTH domain